MSDESMSMFGSDLARPSAMGGRSSGCRKKNSLICASSTGLTLEGLNAGSEIFPSSILKRSL